MYAQGSEESKEAPSTLQNLVTGANETLSTLIQISQKMTDLVRSPQQGIEGIEGPDTSKPDHSDMMSTSERTEATDANR